MSNLYKSLEMHFSVFLSHFFFPVALLLPYLLFQLAFYRPIIDRPVF